MKFAVVILLLCCTQRVVAIPIDTIEARQATPLAPRGGVLMVQLMTEINGDEWPSEIEVTFEDGTRRKGVVGWIEKNTNTSQWTSNPSTIRPITPSDNTLHINPKDVTTGPVLLIELPEQGDGDLRFCGSRYSPRWVDLPESLSNLSIGTNTSTTILVPESVDELPEWNALEYWRWTLLASRKNVLAPPPPKTSEVERLAAMQGAQVWRIGFNRLARSSRGVAAACRDLLSNTAHDGEHQYACWVVNPQSLQRLLYTMLDLSISSEQLIQRALGWSEEQQQYVVWLEQVYGNDVIISIANPTLEPIVTSIKWEEKSDIPIAVEIPALQTLRTHVARPPLMDLSIFGPVTTESQLQWLTLKIGMRTYNFPIVPPNIVAVPPSIRFSTLHPLWNLQSVQRRQPSRVHPSNSTAVQLRKVFGVWELFIRCNGTYSNSKLPDTVQSIAQLCGIEAIAILHPDTNFIVAISPDEQVLAEGMEIYRKVDKHGWVVRIVLPNHWTDTQTLSFAVARTHGDSTRVETGPLPCVPWDITPTPIIVDLIEWDMIEGFPQSG